MISVDCSELKRYTKKINDTDFKKIMANVLTKNANKAMTRIIFLTNVDTGLLRRKWKMTDIIETDTTVSTTLENNATRNKVAYASFVNNGHHLRNGKWWEGFHFMEKGLNEANVEQGIEYDIRNDIERIFS